MTFVVYFDAGSSKFTIKRLDYKYKRYAQN